MSPRSEWWFNFIGWLLFSGSAAFFIWSSLRAGDWIAIFASALFLIACLFFLVPVWRLRPPAD
jgi:hypothetical protein